MSYIIGDEKIGREEFIELHRIMILLRDNLLANSYFDYALAASKVIAIMAIMIDTNEI